MKEAQKKVFVSDYTLNKFANKINGGFKFMKDFGEIDDATYKESITDVKELEILISQMDEEFLTRTQREAWKAYNEVVEDAILPKLYEMLGAPKKDED